MIQLKRDNINAFVMGAPRTGFSLLINIVANLLILTQCKKDIRNRVLNTFTDLAGWHVSNVITRTFADQGIADDLIYNRNFRELIGGPVWLDPQNPSRACFRKYIGVRGRGDFTLITSHPYEVLDSCEVVHSHYHTKTWLEHPGYANHIKLASVRNPVGTINSACFSINALTSEYIQRFISPEKDNDELRQHLALYKLTDLDFFEGLIKSLKNYLEEFLECQTGYIVMRWEDLITEPVQTIRKIGDAISIPVDTAFATMIWQRIGHTNLTGAHKHNYRRGHGKVGGWRATLTNEHLSLMRTHGIELLCEALGYGKLKELDEADYTPFQQKVSGYLRRGEIFKDYPDEDLFGFAFNKSNLDSSKFSSFQRYGWRTHTQIERSNLMDEQLLFRVWDAAEAAVGRFNAAYHDLMMGDYSDPGIAVQHINDVLVIHGDVFGEPEDLKAARISMEHAVRSPAMKSPRLLCTIGTTNVVIYGGLFYGLPQALGPIDLENDSVISCPDVMVASSLQELTGRISVTNIEHG